VSATATRSVPQITTLLDGLITLPVLAAPGLATMSSPAAAPSESSSQPAAVAAETSLATPPSTNAGASAIVDVSHLIAAAPVIPPVLGNGNSSSASVDSIPTGLAGPQADSQVVSTDPAFETMPTLIDPLSPTARRQK